MVPIAFEMVAKGGGSSSMFGIVSGAVISGAIAGGLIIPFSDTSVMTAAACGISPMAHAQTQLPQVLLVSLIAALGYLLLGLGVNIGGVLLGGALLVALLHGLLTCRQKSPPTPLVGFKSNR
jgi:Na+/H+ antiporter NhaC